ncbi:hypothetical protein HY419_00130, partial [candidate division WWE3 bacterium]|nr:hypothetical protein [candidate division WWE3 bacterium]
VFTELKNYIIGRKKKFEIKYFLAKLDDLSSERVRTLYLSDLGDLEEDEERLKLEIDSALRRLKTETVERELKILSGKIKEAEANGDSNEVGRLSSEFKNVSERLI